ncbi:MAG: hypothetical protein ACP5RH_00160 [Leptodesmis sp.]|uniref:hypothetical protein n=1 Tax=Leptodesmis sp. TaxID=3100501 RepID=UPI003D10627D
MNTQDQARALMIRHKQMIRNRENCVLSRAAAEIGMPSEQVHDVNAGKSHPDRPGYDRSSVGLS